MGGGFDTPLLLPQDALACPPAVQALDAAMADKKRLHLLNVLLDSADRSPAMTRLAKRLAQRLSGR